MEPRPVETFVTLAGTLRRRQNPALKFFIDIRKRHPSRFRASPAKGA